MPSPEEQLMQIFAPSKRACERFTAAKISTTIMPQPKCLFLTMLPPEIRNMIYMLVFPRVDEDHESLDEPWTRAELRREILGKEVNLSLIHI